MSGKIDRSAEIYGMMIADPDMPFIRPGKTYRWFRRSVWRGTNPWASFNQPQGKWPFGTPPVSGYITTRSRSKYMPHESVKRGGTGPKFAA